MNEFALAKRSCARSIRSHRAVAVILILMIAATAGVTWAVRTSALSSSRSLTAGLGAREIQVVEGLGGPGSPSLSRASIEGFAALPHVEFVYPMGSMGADAPAEMIESGRVQGAWWLTPQNVRDDRVKDPQGNPVAHARAGEILVPQGYSDLLGREVTLGITAMLSRDSATAQKRAFRVVGVYDPATVQGEQPDTVFMNAAEFQTLQRRGSLPGASPYSSVSIYVDEAENVSAVQSAIESEGFAARSAQGAGIGFEEAQRSMAHLSSVMIALMAVSALFAGLFISSGWIGARIEEIGLFSSLGWSRASIQRVYLYEAGIFSCAASAVGVLLAYAVLTGLSRARQSLPGALGAVPETQALSGQAWVLFLPLAVVPLGFLLGCMRGVLALRKVDADSLLRQIA